ncbi:response regulator [Altererythrobacter aerius]|uniref:Response regulator n=1 Tax=Tsuneonella aeria TaxID=1837929 RepID=A0A6I4T9Z4_9SPHN|nr:response regulator [Tsuneonella aeria]MXO74032.1 response regulator [Tsuneonella aeria]
MIRLKDQTILVLEDEAIIAMVLEDALLDSGANAIMVDSLEKAEALILSGRALDAAVLDVNVHGGQSYDVARLLLARGVPFIFASGYGNAIVPPDLAHIRSITKPYVLEDIADALCT